MQIEIGRLHCCLRGFDSLARRELVIWRAGGRPSVGWVVPAERVQVSWRCLRQAVRAIAHQAVMKEGQFVVVAASAEWVVVAADVPEHIGNSEATVGIGCLVGP